MGQGAQRISGLTVVSGVAGAVGVAGVVGVLSLPPPQAASVRVSKASDAPAASRRGMARKEDERGFIDCFQRGVGMHKTSELQF
jgi:hypothetical protein